METANEFKAIIMEVWGSTLVSTNDIIFLVILVLLSTGCSKDKKAEQELQPVIIHNPKPIPAEIDSSRIIRWEDMDINQLSFEELVDSFGQPCKTDFLIVNSPSIPDSLAETLMANPDARLLTYYWSHLSDSDVWLTVYVLSQGHEFHPVFGFAQHSHWIMYE